MTVRGKADEWLSFGPLVTVTILRVELFGDQTILRYWCQLEHVFASS